MKGIYKGEMCLVFTGVEVYKGGENRISKRRAARITGPLPVPWRRRCGATVRDLFRRASGGRDVAGCCEWHWGLLRPAIAAAVAVAAVRARLCLWVAVRGWPE